MAGNTIAVRPFVEQFAALKAGLPGAGVPWLGGLREAAIERFCDLGVPTPRVEAWKYTRLRPLEKTAYRAAGETDRTADGTLDVGRLPTILGGAACQHRSDGGLAVGHMQVGVGAVLQQQFDHL